MMSESSSWPIAVTDEMVSVACASYVERLTDQGADPARMRASLQAVLDSLGPEQVDAIALKTGLSGEVHGRIQVIRGMCTDERPYSEIDRKLCALDDVVDALVFRMVPAGDSALVARGGDGGAVASTPTECVGDPGSIPGHPRDDAPRMPSRGVSRYIEHRAHLERQLDEWDAEMEGVGIAPTDKVRTLFRYALDELRREDRETTEAKVMGR